MTRWFSSFSVIARRAIPELCAEWLLSEWGHFDPSVSLRDKIEELKAGGGSGELPLNFVAREGGELLGMGRLLKTDLECMRELSPWLGDLYVKPDSRRNGVGSRLVGYGEELARELGFRQLYLFVSDQEDFYYRLGWTLHSEVFRKGFSREGACEISRVKKRERTRRTTFFIF